MIRWYINRMLKMPAPEVPFRVFDKLRQLSDKFGKHTFQPAARPYADTISNLAVHWDSQSIRDRFPEHSARLLWLADQAMHHRFETFGIENRFGRRIAWHRDPVTRKNWPLKFWGDLNYRDKNFGGVKFVWELNRLYCLFPLALAHRLTGREAYAAKMLWVIRDWLEANPYPLGINWTSGIELGIRLANLVWALAFVHPFPVVGEDLQRINQFVYLHATHLDRYPSRYSSANNHLLAEGFGLFLAGLFFPGLPGAAKWYKKGKAILEREAGRQILDDGGSFEYSTSYLSFVADFFLLFSFVCETCAISYDKTVDRRIRKACDFISAILDCRGNLPNMGDQDSAVLVNFGLSNAENCTSLCHADALRYPRKENSHTGAQDMKTWLLTGKPLPEVPSQRSPLVRLFKSSGICLIRDIHQNREVQLVGNATPLGMPPLYAHGHLDALSFTLSVNGVEFFVDSGTYCYHGNETWRSYFRSTRAHNTVSVGGVDMSRQIGDFMFATPYRIIENRLDPSEQGVGWHTTMEAFPAPGKKLLVTRQVQWQPRTATFLIQDSLASDTAGSMEFLFHLHPQCRAVPAGDSVKIIREGISITLAFESDIRTDLFRGCLNPVLGWYSPEFNRKVKTTTIRGVKPFRESAVSVTRIALDRIDLE